MKKFVLVGLATALFFVFIPVFSAIACDGDHDNCKRQTEPNHKCECGEKKKCAKTADQQHEPAAQVKIWHLKVLNGMGKTILIGLYWFDSDDNLKCKNNVDSDDPYKKRFLVDPRERAVMAPETFMQGAMAAGRYIIWIKNIDKQKWERTIIEITEDMIDLAMKKRVFILMRIKSDQANGVTVEVP